MGPCAISMLLAEMEHLRRHLANASTESGDPKCRLEIAMADDRAETIISRLRADRDNQLYGAPVVSRGAPEPRRVPLLRLPPNDEPNRFSSIP